MKNLLTIFGSISLISMTSITSIACKNINKSKKEEPSNKEKEKNKQADDNKEPKENSEQPKRTKEENFELIKKYGIEVYNLLLSLKNDEHLSKPENSELLRLVKDISELYKGLGRFKTIDEFKNEFNSDKWKNKGSSKSSEEFLNKLFEQWDKTVTEYEKQKDSILKILKQ
ncbi:putative lipoprotein [Mycoplasma leachii PG50]|uniref:Putative lipoprotein n=1 Tax=Mycoplasma leachii (strain DSM 21131 / NCTC 10133 / N29 / PG50) TaxID=880447 RepID=E4PTU3_MYCLG|nr:lipoprotein [Mycoplasma leachii]ADR24223.1 putative lipoprotein [Mycoplasma leachii PG50]CBV66871.1 Lipoprotein, putative [Mycoplasma leachii 99/014/6]